MLTGCDGVRNALGMERHIPDETKVVSRPPLTLPPEFDLRPPGSATPVSAEHETGLSLSQLGSPEQPKEEKGFFGRLFSGDIFGGDEADDTAKPAPAAPNAEGGAAPPAAAPADAAAAPAAGTAPAAGAQTP
jgi:hypothetical protein